MSKREPKFWRHDIPATSAVAAQPSRERWTMGRSILEREHCATINLEARASDGLLIATTKTILYTPDCVDLHIEDLKRLKAFWLDKLNPEATNDAR